MAFPTEGVRLLEGRSRYLRACTMFEYRCVRISLPPSRRPLSRGGSRPCFFCPKLGGAARSPVRCHLRR